MVTLKLSAKDTEGLLDQVMDDIVDSIFAESQENIVKLGIVDEGTLLGSGEVKREFLKKQITYTTSYADTIEFGRIPGSMPPVDSLKGWIRRKLGVQDEKKVTSIAWAIATDLKKNGTMPRPYLGPAIDKA